MKVSELIALLQQSPQDLDVRIETETCAVHIDTVDQVYADPTPMRNGTMQDYVVIYPGDFKP